jgi:hypothetical protein
VAPWSAYWDRNLFIQNPVLHSWVANTFVRGAISGIGIVTATAGLAELAGAFRLRRGDTMHEDPNVS